MDVEKNLYLLFVIYKGHHLDDRCDRNHLKFDNNELRATFTVVDL